MSAPAEIVVGYDGSDHSVGAVRRACALAGEESRVTVVTAYRVPQEVRSYEFFEDVAGAFKESAEEVLRSAREIVPGGPFAIRYVAAEGSPAETLASCARELDADMLVVGTRGGGRWRSLGSVPTKLLQEPPCPVLVVPSAPHQKA